MAKKKAGGGGLSKTQKGVLSYAGVGAKKWQNLSGKRKNAAQSGYADWLASQAAAPSAKPAAAPTSGGSPGAPVLGGDPNTWTDAEKAKKKAADQLTQQNAITYLTERLTGQRGGAGGNFYAGAAGGTPMSAFDQWQNDVWLPEQERLVRASFNPQQLYLDATGDQLGNVINLPNLNTSPEALNAARRQYLNSGSSQQAGSQFFTPTGRWSWWD